MILRSQRQIRPLPQRKVAQNNILTLSNSGVTKKALRRNKIICANWTTDYVAQAIKHNQDEALRNSDRALRQAKSATYLLEAELRDNDYAPPRSMIYPTPHYLRTYSTSDLGRLGIAGTQTFEIGDKDRNIIQLIFIRNELNFRRKLDQLTSQSQQSNVEIDWANVRRDWPGANVYTTKSIRN